MTKPVYKILVKKSVKKAIASFTPSVRERIYDTLKRLAQNPYAHGALKLKGLKNHWRIRAGSFRIVYEIQSGELIVLVLKIADRKDVYKNF